MKRLSVEARHKLDKLARDIRGRYENTNLLVRSARERCNEAIVEAILCGQSLNEAKAIVGHGRWLEWLKSHCEGVSERTARNYMALANRKHVADLDSAGSLRQAYIGAGIIADSRTERVSGQNAERVSTRRMPQSRPKTNRGATDSLTRFSDMLSSLVAEAENELEASQRKEFSDKLMFAALELLTFSGI